MKSKCFLPEIKASFNLTLSNILSQIGAEQLGKLFRITFFSSTLDDKELEVQRQSIKEIIADHFGDKIPTWNLVAQAPYCMRSSEEIPSEPLTLAAEACFLECTEITVNYKTFEDRPYVVTEKGSIKKLYVSGFIHNDSYDVIEQCEVAFEQMHRLLKYENMPINSIARQWNYVPKIVGIVGEFQNYQQFNDARSHFYNQTSWPEGYPAATGIGVTCGKISVDFDAVKGIKTQAVDNLNQVAAHAYSQDVLIGKKELEKTTPKFERAKISYTTLYISGTASIIGEESIGWDDIEKQTHVTLDNIDYLRTNGGSGQMISVRVYIKRPELIAAAKAIVDERYSDTDAIYIISDVCRDELLIEIEGLIENGNYD